MNPQRWISVVFVLLSAGCATPAPASQVSTTPRASGEITASATPSTGVSEGASASAPAAPGITGCGGNGEDVGELTGVWDGDDGGLYYLRQMGECVWWFGTSLREVGEAEQPGFANVAVGRIVGDRIELEWADVPLGAILGGGTLRFAILADPERLVQVAATGTGFGGQTFTRHEPSNASPSASESASASP